MKSRINVWDDLRHRSCLYIPTQDYIWQFAYLKVFGTCASLNITEISSPEQDIEAIAINIYAKSILGKYELSGITRTHEPGDFVYKNESSLRALVSEFTRLSEPLIIGRIRADSPTIRAMREGFRHRGIVIVHKVGNTPYINLNPDIKDITSVLSKSLIQDLKRARRNADKFGNVTFKIYSPREQKDFLPLYEMFLEVENSGWKNKAGSALKQKPLQEKFFRQYGIHAAEQGILRFAVMYIDNEIVAIQYALEWGERFWLLKIGYNDNFSKCSPGMLLMQETLTYALNSHLKSYEFLGSAELWTKRWTKTEWPTVRIEAYPFSIKGMLALCYKILHYTKGKIFSKFKHV